MLSGEEFKVVKLVPYVTFGCLISDPLDSSASVIEVSVNGFFFGDVGEDLGTIIVLQVLDSSRSVNVALIVLLDVGEGNKSNLDCSCLGDVLNFV